MERDALLAHGASHCLRERLMTLSDEFTMVFCDKCSAPSNKDNRGYFKCIMCGSAGLIRTNIPYIEQHLTSLIASAGMNLGVTIKRNYEDVPIGKQGPDREGLHSKGGKQSYVQEALEEETVVRVELNQQAQEALGQIAGINLLHGWSNR